MAKVKILLEKGETPADADEALLKALAHHATGDAHDEDVFDDPAMMHMAQRLEEIHTKIQADMLREISDLLDKEYSHGGE